MNIDQALRAIESLMAQLASGGHHTGNDHVARPRGNIMCAVAAALATAASVHGQSTVYVDDDAPVGGDGRTWQTAFRDLQDALNRVELAYPFGAVVKIAGGVYTTHNVDGSVPPGFRIVTSGVTLIGGFAGLGHADPDAHDPSAFASVLSGDWARNDGPGFAGRADNLSVVISTAGADAVTLRDLTIRGAGNGTSSAIAVIGGGAGGGSSLLIAGCTITDNLGSALLAGPTTQVFMYDSLIEGNRTPFRDVLISAHSISSYRTVIRGNTARDPVFWTATLMEVLDGGRAFFDHCLIAGDAGAEPPDAPVAALIGGAGGGVVARGCTFVAERQTQPIFSGPIHVTLVNSVAGTGDGSEVSLSRDPLESLAVARSCIHASAAAVATAARTAIIADGVVYSSPRFVSPRGPDGQFDTYLDNDFRLAASSPAIDFANAAWLLNDYSDFDQDDVNDEPLPIDLAGAARVRDDAGTPNQGLGLGGALDLGPYEFQGTSCRVDFDASGTIAVGDVFAFLQAWFIRSPEADFNRTGTTELGDVFDFLAAYFAGCA